MKRLQRATVVAVREERPGAVELSVRVDGGDARSVAIAYPQLTGPVGPGDRVLLNTMAVELGLGTGGAHFVVAVLDEREMDISAPAGRIVKLRYTPHQVAVGAAEEASADREAMAGPGELEGAPVVWLPLHSMLGPVAAGAVAAGARRVVYVMTDGAALPGALSRLSARLRSEDLVAATVTAGQAFGGDVEAVNVFTGLLVARRVLHADVVVVGDGPGNTGTETEWGATAVSSAMSLNAAHVLHGRPIAALRVSFADPRERHRVVSHHVLTALSRVAVLPVHVAVPALEGEQRASVWAALKEAGLEAKHQLVEANGGPALDLLRERAIDVRSMGRSVADDPAFFLAAGAAGVLAGRMAAGSDRWRASLGTDASA